MFARASMMRSFLGCVAFVAAAAAGSAAFGQLYSNTAAITIPDLGTAAPYPSTITVAGGPASIRNIIVTLRGFSHTFPNDVQVLLVAPSGQAIVLMSNNGGGNYAVNLTLGFSSTAVLPLPIPLLSGTYVARGGSFAFTAPAPAPPFLPSLTNLAGADSNGVWRLFVNDAVASDSGSFAGGWSIMFVPEPITPIARSMFTYQGKLTGGASNGTIDARFTVFDALIGTNALNRVGEVSTAANVALVNSVFTAPVNPNVLLPGDRKIWLQVEVANPSGSAFVALTPRQPITPAPLAATAITAGWSSFAALADSALTLDYSAGLLIGSSAVVEDQYAVANRGGKSRFGYALNAAGTNEFLGMQAIVAPGTNGGGNSGDVAFFTWESNTFTSREIMRVNGRGNVGIGTTAPAAKLDVRGSIALGNNGQFRAAAGTEDLRLLCGTISLNGARTNGSGFTSSRPDVGIYRITYDTPFSSATVLTANVYDNGSPLTVSLLATTLTGSLVYVRNSAGALTDSSFGFTVIGPR